MQTLTPQVVTIQDYVKVLVSILRESGSAAALVEYIAMLCLLQAEMGQYSVAEVASACMLLSRILLNKGRSRFQWVVCP